MKSTEHFKNTIKAYLDSRASDDALFAVNYAKQGKNLDDCITYILNTVYKSGCNGFHDDEIFGIAVHYWDEDSIEVGKDFDCRVVVNHTVQLSDEEKQQARQDAIQRAQDEAYRKITQPVKKAKRAEMNVQPSLFDF